MRPALPLALLLALSGYAEQGFAQEKPPIKKRDDLFGPDRLWSLHLRIDAKEYAAMQPKWGGFSFGKGGAKKAAPPKEEPKKDNPDKRDTRIGAFGTEYPYVKGDLEFEGAWLKDVGIRYKGNSTYLSSAFGLKKPFKIDVNHFVDGQKLHGVGLLSLGNNVFDPTRAREALGYSRFRAARVPAPRTAFLQVHLTVPDKHDREYLGLYTLIEPVDKPFLRAHFKDDKGMLCKPEGILGLHYLGEDWTAYEGKYRPKRAPSAEQKRRLIEFTHLVNRADEKTFREEIGSYLDVEAFLRFVAVNSLIGNLDCFQTLGHNYYLYLDAKTNRFHFIPYDLDLAFGGMDLMSTPLQQTEWSIAKPYIGKVPLVERVLGMAEHEKTYRAVVKELAEGPLSEKELYKELDILEAVVKDSVAREKAPAFRFGFSKPKIPVREFIQKRSASVAAQLEGKSEGKVLTGGLFGFGLGGFPGGPKKTPPDVKKKE